MYEIVRFRQPETRDRASPSLPSGKPVRPRAPPDSPRPHFRSTPASNRRRRRRSGRHKARRFLTPRGGCIERHLAWRRIARSPGRRRTCGRTDVLTFRKTFASRGRLALNSDFNYNINIKTCHPNTEFKMKRPTPTPS